MKIIPKNPMLILSKQMLALILMSKDNLAKVHILNLMSLLRVQVFMLSKYSILKGPGSYNPTFEPGRSIDYGGSQKKKGPSPRYKSATRGLGGIPSIPCILVLLN
jgi:hypothetical protein